MLEPEPLESSSQTSQRWLAAQKTLHRRTHPRRRRQQLAASAVAHLPDFGLCARGGAPKLIETDVKPLVNGLRKQGGRIMANNEQRHGRPRRLGGASTKFLYGQLGLQGPRAWLRPSRSHIPGQLLSSRLTLCIAWYLSQICWQVRPSSKAYIPQQIKALPAAHHYSTWHL